MLAILPIGAQAADVSLRMRGVEPVAPGDTIEVDIGIAAGAQPLTSASVFLHVDPSQLQIVPTLENRPFVRGTDWPATVYENTYDSASGQLSYVAVGGLASGGERSVGTGTFTLATVRFRVPTYPREGIVSVALDAAGQRQPVYTLASAPGVEQRFQMGQQDLQINVVRAGFTSLPDRVEGAGQPWQFDLADYYVGDVTAIVDWGSQSDGAMTIAREGSVVTVTSWEDGRIDYWATHRDGVRYAGSFRVEIEQTPAAVLPGGTLDLVEDEGPYRFALGDFFATNRGPGVLGVEGGDFVEARIEGDQLVVWSLPDAAGLTNLIVSFCSPSASCQTSEWLVSVAPRNDSPRLAESDPLEVAVGQRYVLPLTSVIADVDDELETVLIEEYITEYARLFRDGNWLVVEGRSEGAGELLLRAVDPQGGSSERLWPVRVVALSEGPQWTARPEIELALDRAVAVELSTYVVDVDTPVDRLSWSLRGDGIEVAWDTEAADIAWLRAESPGTAILYVEVADPEGNVAVETWTFQVQEPAEQLPPVTAPSNEVQTAEGAGERPSPAESAEIEPQEVEDGSVESAGANDLPVDTEPAWTLIAGDSVEIEAGSEWSYDLTELVEGVAAAQLEWEIRVGAGLAQRWGLLQVTLYADSTFAGQTEVELVATDASGYQRRAYWSVEVLPGPESIRWTDIPDAALAAGDSLSIELSTRVDRSVEWSVRGGEGLVVEWVDGGVLLWGETGFSGRSVLIFTAVDAWGNTATDIVRIDVLSALEEEADEVSPTPETSASADDAVDDALEWSLASWQDITLYRGEVDTTRSLDALVQGIDPSTVEWSLRGGVFVTAELDAARRIHLDGKNAQVGREVFRLVAQRGGQLREQTLGVQVRVRPLVLFVPEGEVEMSPDGYDLRQLLGQPVDAIAWQATAAAGEVRVEGYRLYVDAPAGLYEIAVDAQGSSGQHAAVVLQVRVPDVPAVESEAVDDEELVEVVPEVEVEPVPPQWQMPVRIEVESGAGGRWPLRVVPGDSPIEELELSLVASDGAARIEAGHLVLEKVDQTQVVILYARDAHGLVAEVRVEIVAVDRRPPLLALHPEVLEEGIVRWVLHADEGLASVLLMLDDQPLAPLDSGAQERVWQHALTDAQPRYLRAVAVDRAGNRADIQRVFTAASVGRGMALDSPDGALRILGTEQALPLLVYEQDGAYRIECAAEVTLELALVASTPNRVLHYAQGGAAQSLRTRQVNGRLRSRVSGSGWLTVTEGFAESTLEAGPRFFPNPFNATLTIGVDMPTAGWLQIEIFDLLGRRVRQLIAQERGAGPWHIAWDGRDEKLRAVASGPYFIAVRAADQRYRGRVMLLR